MKAAEPSFSYDLEGNATMSKTIWEAMPGGMRQGMTKAIAYQAICGNGELRQQQVTIRSSETQEILANQIVVDFDR